MGAIYTVYFAHPVSDYNTVFELRIRKMINDSMDDIFAAHLLHEPPLITQLINPNQLVLQMLYKKYGMDMFIALCGQCQACVFIPFPDRSVGAGVVKEVDAFLVAGKPVFEVGIDPRGQLQFQRVEDLTHYQTMGVEATRAKIRYYKALADGGRPPIPQPEATVAAYIDLVVGGKPFASSPIGLDIK